MSRTKTCVRCFRHSDNTFDLVCSVTSKRERMVAARARAGFHLGPFDHGHPGLTATDPSVLVPLLPLPGLKAFFASLLDCGVGTGGRRRARLGRGPRRPTGRWRGCGPCGAPWPRWDATGRPATRRCCSDRDQRGQAALGCGRAGLAKPRAHGVAARPAGPRARGRRRSARRGCGRARLGRRRGRARPPAARGALAARSRRARGALDPDRAPDAVRLGPTNDEANLKAMVLCAWLFGAAVKLCVKARRAR